MLETQQLIDERRPELGAPRALEALESGIDLDARGVQRIAISAAPLLDHRPRHARGDECDAAMALREQVLGQAARAVAIGRGQRRDVRRLFDLLEHDGRRPQLDDPLRVPAAQLGLAGEEEEGPVGTVLEQRGEQGVGCPVGTARLDQHAVATVASDVADAGDDQVGHRVGEEARVLVEHQERQRVAARRAQTARGRVGVVAELGHRRGDPLARLLRHEVRAAVDEIRDGLRRDAGASSDIAHRRSLGRWPLTPFAPPGNALLDRKSTSV